ncbi:MAG: DNA polymerase III subunit delta [Gammaproteobacteria bacterium]|nr:DNA polymerase III subunit delta [Gammaproteobacteria bacterium]
MQIRFSQLKDNLARAPIPAMLVSGDEPYQQMLAADMLRSRAKELGFTERKILTVEKGFDWSELGAANNNLSLFGERTLIDLRIPTGKPGASGSKAIVTFLKGLHEDVMLLVQAPRLDRNGINSAWAKAIEKAGVVLRVWPLNEVETKSWIKQKLNSKGFSVTDEIVALIAQQVEGNLLAAMQEIEKIALISETKQLDIQAINAMLTNSSRYSLNELMDAVIKKDLSRLVRIMQSLEKEDIAPPLLLWGLTEQIRKMADASKLQSRGQVSGHIEKLVQLSHIHQQHIGTGNESQMTRPEILLQQCAWTDRVIKGRANGNPWHELLQLSIAVQISA